MCDSSTDPWEQTKKAANTIGDAAEKARSKIVKGVETAGMHAPGVDPQAALDQATAQAESDQIKAEQDATASANAMLQGKRRRKRAGAGLLSDASGGSVLAGGASGSVSVLGTGA
jgi:hypothetical protein